MNKNKYPLEKLNKIPQVELCYERPALSQMRFIRGITEAEEMFRLCYPPKMMDVKECFWAAFLTANLRVLGLAEVAVGNQKGVIVSNKEIAQIALLIHANSVLVCHNHPSGSLKETQSDVRLTKSLQKTLKLVDVELLDHIILTSESYVSLAEKGYLTS